jgi:hypothetical protein
VVTAAPVIGNPYARRIRPSGDAFILKVQSYVLQSERLSSLHARLTLPDPAHAVPKSVSLKPAQGHPVGSRRAVLSATCSL